VFCLYEIKYSELVFKVKFSEDAVLPKHKTLMLNGALLNVLVDLYCIHKRICRSCSIVSRCLIQKLLGNGYEADKPLILQTYNLQPYYVIDCNDENKNFQQDQELTFSIRLFHEAIDYISQFIYAFQQIGSTGLSKNKARYTVIGIYNNQNRPIFENGVFQESNIHIEYISDYITWRKSCIKNNVALLFTTPFILEQANFHYFFDIDNLFYSIKERLRNFGALEQQDTVWLGAFDEQKYIVHCTLHLVKQIYPIKALNFNKVIIGLKGEIKFSKKAYDLIDYLIACEKLCIGSHILLGYGRYIIKGDQ